MASYSDILEGKTSAEPAVGKLSGPLLAVDVGSVHTRAILLDVVEGMYRLIARGEVPTTAVEPWNDILIGVYNAIMQVSQATGRAIIDENGDLILPEAEEFGGVDAFVATASAGQPLRAVLVGLMPDFSLRSGKRAADSIYLSLADTISLADKRGIDGQIDALLAAEADLIFVVGGTDGGAVESMQKNLDTVLLAYMLMDNQVHPPLLYAGNSALSKAVQEKGARIGAKVLAADNVRPALGIEYLDGAQAQLASLYSEQKSRSTPGFAELVAWTEEGVQPTAHSFGRMIHLLGGLRGGNALGIDLGSMATTVAASIGGERYLNVFGQLGIGHRILSVLEETRLENLTRWLSREPDADEVLNYMWNKSLFPHTVPNTHEELEIEHAVAREIIRYAASSARQSWRGVSQRGLLPSFETILLSGAALTNTPGYGLSLLVALDALLPVGVSRVYLDPYCIAPALGVVAPSDPQVVVQMLQTGAFYDLGTVVSISGRARQGEIVLTGSLRPEGSNKPEPFEVRYGSISMLPLAYGERAELTLQPRHVGVEGIGRKRKMAITGGELGLVVDARGRPWRFPRAAEQRHLLLRSWQQAVAQEG